MTDDQLIGDLLRSLQSARDAVVWKLDGLSEHDVRRPLTRTGTNLLGLVKHLVGVEAGYLGLVFARPFPEPLPRAEDDAAPNADLWATPQEGRTDLVDLYRRVQRHGDVTLHRILVHLITETHRHAGHADVVRELVDGAAGRS